jgi:hypothetical protein
MTTEELTRALKVKPWHAFAFEDAGDGETIVVAGKATYTRPPLDEFIAEHTALGRSVGIFNRGEWH